MNTGIPTADSAAPSPATSERGFIRRLWYKFFFSTERRYQMFQTIVGGTIANLIAASVIAALAVAAGALTISFSWSWSGYRDYVLAALPAVVLFTTYYVIMSARRTTRGWKRSLRIGLWILAIGLIIVPLMLNIFGAITISFHPGKSG